MEPQCPVGHGDGLEIMDQGLTDGSWLAGCFLAFFFLSSSHSLISGFLGFAPLMLSLLALAPTQSRPRCPNRVPPSSDRAPTLFKFQPPSRPCQTLSSPPVGLSFLIQPPTDRRQPPTGHRHPETRSAPLLIFLSVLVPPWTRRSRSQSRCAAPAWVSACFLRRPSRKRLIMSCYAMREQQADGSVHHSSHLPYAGSPANRAEFSPAQAGTSRLWVFPFLFLPLWPQPPADFV